MKKTMVLVLNLLLTVSVSGIALADTTAGQHIANPHDSFSQNTASCASCHSTHNADAPELLKSSSTYDTCTNCHDGTESVYDVVNGQIGSTAADTTGYVPPDADGGLFGSAANSRHAAMSGTNIDLSTMGGNGSYSSASANSTFTCDSCHDPHKTLSDVAENSSAPQYNSRLLKAAPKLVEKDDPKFTFSTNATDSSVSINPTASGAILALNYGIYNTYPQTPTLYQFDSSTNTYTQVTYTNFGFDSTSGKWKFTGVSGFSGSNAYRASFWVKAPQVTIDYGTAYRTADSTQTGPEYAVGKNTAGYSVTINQWCGTCHNDYYSSISAQSTSGDYNNSKYRHAVGTSDNGMVSAAIKGTFLPRVNGTQVATSTSIQLPLSTNGQVICLTCHFAHGSKAKSDPALASTDQVTVDKDSNSGGGTITNNGKLLRYDNRDTCELCHQK